MFVRLNLRCLAPWLSAALLPLAASAQPELTLEAALAEAFTRSPALLVAGTEVDAARGRLLAARAFPYNPEVELDVGDRRGLGDSSTDQGIAVSQQLELGGQRGKRVRVAELDLESAEASFRRARGLLAASVAMAFAEAVAAEDFAELAEAEAELARELLGVTQRRFDAGAANRIDLNFARASAARSERRGENARASVREARSLLAETVGLDPAAPPDPAGPMTLPPGEPAPLAILVEEALGRRADLEALEHARGLADARLRLARADRMPDLSIGAFYEEEEGTDRILGASVRISLPFFNRGKGGIAEAEAGIERAAAKATSRELAVRREVYSALARYQAARTSAEQLAEHVVGNLTESLDLLGRSFTAGKVGFSDLLIFRRELVEGRREHIKAATAAWTARVALDLAVGRLPAAADPSSAGVAGASRSGSFQESSLSQEIVR